MKKFKPFLFLSFFLFCSSLSIGQNWLWGIAGSNYINAYAMTSDNKGNVFLAGTFIGSITFGSSTLTNTGDDFCLVKFDSSGNVLWAKQAMSKSVHGNTCEVLSVGTDPSGNVFVTGDFYDSVLLGSIVLQSDSPQAFIAKYDFNGNVLWAKQTVSSGFDSYGTGYSITSDIYGNVYVLGTVTGKIYADTIALTNPGNQQVFLAKYDPGGNILWAEQFTGANTWVGHYITSDMSGNIFVTGTYADSVSIGSTILKSSTSTGGSFIAKLGPNGNTLWLRGSNTISTFESYIQVNSIVTDFSGSVYITGDFHDTVAFGPYILKSIGFNESDIFLAKYNSNGNLVWAKQSQHGVSDFWTGYSLSADKYNQIYLSGGHETTSGPNLNENTIIFCNDTLSINNTPNSAIIMKLDTAGNTLCGSIVRTGGGYNSVSCDSSGKYVYLGGDISDSITFNRDLLNPTFFEQPFIARWWPCDIIDYSPPIPCGKFIIPNVFTPNGDGRNDYLIINAENTDAYFIVIYDRWGIEVYKSTDPTKYWDGKTESGMNVSDGVYYYVITYTCEKETYNKKGFVQVIR